MRVEDPRTVAVPTFERIRRLIARFGKVDPLVQIPDRERGDLGAAQTDLQADRKNRAIW